MDHIFCNDFSKSWQVALLFLTLVSFHEFFKNSITQAMAKKPLKPQTKLTHILSQQNTV
jgi:hypothetical protein